MQEIALSRKLTDFAKLRLWFLRRVFEKGLLLATVRRRDRTVHLSQKTGGYCWPTSFKVLGVLFLREVFSAFLPSKKTCWAHKFWHLGVRQQYLMTQGSPPRMKIALLFSVEYRRSISRTCKVRGTTVDQVSRLIGHFWALEGNLSASHYPGVAYKSFLT